MKKSAPLLQTVAIKHASLLKGTNRFQDLLTNLRYEGKPRLGHNLKQTEDVLEFLDRDVRHQFRYEEKNIFPFLLRHIPKLEAAISLLQGEHHEFRDRLKKFRACLRQFQKGTTEAHTSEAMRELGIYLIYLLRHHVRAEKQIYKAVLGNLRAGEKAELKSLLEKGE